MMGGPSRGSAVFLPAQPLTTLLCHHQTPGIASCRLHPPPLPKAFALALYFPSPSSLLAAQLRGPLFGTRLTWNSFPVLLSRGGEGNGSIAASPPHCTAWHPGRSPPSPGRPPPRAGPCLPLGLGPSRPQHNFRESSLSGRVTQVERKRWGRLGWTGAASWR